MRVAVQLVRLLSGAAFYMWCVLTRGTYRGGQRFYAAAQTDTRSGHAATAVLRSPPALLAVSFDAYLASRDSDRLSPIAAAQYADDSLHGYGDAEFSKGGDRLEEQQRGLILPVLEQALDELADGATVVEIGTGNGDVIAHLAERHPRLRFIGVDFSTTIARGKHHRDNLDWRSGYALDLLEAGDLRGDLVFASSTLIVFTPRELERYVAAIAAAGFSRVVLNEPTWAGLEQSRNGGARSQHLEGATWHHSYAAYLTAGGFRPRAFEFFDYQPPGSPRQDVRVLLLDAAR